MTGLPVEIAAADPRVVRPVDLRDRYAHPAKELSRLVEAGVLLRLAHGYYAVVPEHYRGTRWRPSVEAAGLAIAQADYGRDGVAGMGITAARLLGHVSRALGEGVIAAGRQRPALHTTVGRLRFVTRKVSGLDLQRVETELASGWVTTVEQTLLDLADRPSIGELSAAEVAQLIRSLAEAADWRRVGDLAIGQRKRPAAVRAAWAAGVESPVRASRRVSTEGLPRAPGSHPEYGGMN